MLAGLLFELIAVILGVALFEGGRRERLVALIFSVHFALYVLAMGEPIPDIETLYVVDAIQIGFLPVLAWLALRCRMRWIFALTGLQALLVIVWLVTTRDNGLQDLTHRLVFFSLDAAKGACIGWAMVRYLLAAPRRPPEPGRADIDLYEAASARWPGRVVG